MDRIAVLASGGLDSAVLLSDLAQTHEVFPIYIRFGLRWEEAEQATLAAYLTAIARENLKPLTLLDLPVGGLYGQHWSTTGEKLPGYDAPIDADFLPGRNVFLVGLAAVWCSLHAVPAVALGSLVSNPFPDATPEFFADYARLLSGAIKHDFEVALPFHGRHKEELIREHASLPLHLTLTCIDPQTKGATAAEIAASGGPLHCGACIKCRERHDAFIAAGVPDPTRYAGR